MSFRTLHSFTVTLDRKVQETSTRVENGQTITTTSDVVKPVPFTIILKEPSRREKQDLVLFQSVTYNKAIELGLLPKLVMQQKLGKEVANPLSKEEDANLRAMTERLLALSNDFMQLSGDALTMVDTESVKERKERLLIEYMTLQSKVIDMKAAYQSVYDHTAERYTENKTLQWLTLFLTYVTEPGTSDSVPRPFFPGSDYTTKEDKLGDMEDSKDELYGKALEKLPYLWMLFLYGKASTPEEFAKVEEEFKKQAEAEAKIKAEAEAKAKADEVKVDGAKVEEPVLTPEGAQPAPITP
jgi:hypothetical protein